MNTAYSLDDFFTGVNIGFSQRSQTLSEAGEGLGDIVRIQIGVHADRIVGRDYNLLITVQNANATVQATTSFDAFVTDVEFGAEYGDKIQELRILYANKIEFQTFFSIVNNFVPEEDECFTLRISPEQDTDTFNCSEDIDNARDYYCQHTVCIEDDDRDG